MKGLIKSLIQLATARGRNLYPSAAHVAEKAGQSGETMRADCVPRNVGTRNTVTDQRLTGAGRSKRSPHSVKATPERTNDNTYK